MMVSQSVLEGRSATKSFQDTLALIERYGINSKENTGGKHKIISTRVLLARLTYRIVTRYRSSRQLLLQTS